MNNSPLPREGSGFQERCEFHATTLQIVASVRSVAAIIVTQDCDALRASDVTLSEIRGFRDVEHKCKDTIKPEKWKNVITQQARLNLKWFYLPPDSEVGFKEKMAVDFQTIIRVNRIELEERRATLRRGRLKISLRSISESGCRGSSGVTRMTNGTH